jgi:hypothetical protein
LYALNHAADGINAIVLGASYTGSTYPSKYLNNVFFNDLGQGIVRAATVDSNGRIVNVDTFTTGAVYVVQIFQGRDGNLYYVDLDDGVIGRWTFQAPPTTLLRAAATGTSPAKTTPPTNSRGTTAPLVGKVVFQQVGASNPKRTKVPPAAMVPATSAVMGPAAMAPAVMVPNVNAVSASLVAGLQSVSPVRTTASVQSNVPARSEPIQTATSSVHPSVPENTSTNSYLDALDIDAIARELLRSGLIHGKLASRSSLT